MKVMDMRLYEGQGNLKAFFSITTDEGIIIKHFKIMDGKNGLFVSFPSKKGKDDKFYNTVWMARELTDELHDLALQEFKNIGSDSGNFSGDTDPF